MTLAFYIFFFACIVWGVSLSADTNPDKQAIADVLAYVATAMFVIAALLGLAGWFW